MTTATMDALNILCALVALVLPLGLACALLARGGRPGKRRRDGRLDPPPV